MLGLASKMVQRHRPWIDRLGSDARRCAASGVGTGLPVLNDGAPLNLGRYANENFVTLLDARDQIIEVARRPADRLSPTARCSPRILRKRDAGVPIRLHMREAYEVAPLREKAAR